MPNTINGTITVNIKVPGFSNAAARNAISGGTSASRSVGPSGWWNRTGLSSAELNYENMMKRQFLSQQNLMKKNQKEEETARKERLKLGGVPEGVYSKFNPEDALDYDKIQTKEMKGMKEEAELIKKIGVKESLFSGPAFKAMAKFLPILGGVGGILAVAQNSKIISTMTSTTAELLGLLVDVLLMPFLPLLIPILKALAVIIQQIMKFIENPVQYIKDIWNNFIDWLKEGFAKIEILGYKPFAGLKNTENNTKENQDKFPITMMSGPVPEATFIERVEAGVVAGAMMGIGKLLLGKSVYGTIAGGLLIGGGVLLGANATFSGQSAAEAADIPHYSADWLNRLGYGPSAARLLAEQNRETTIQNMNINVYRMTGEGVLTSEELARRLTKEIEKAEQELKDRTP